jgi:hypothetical protein
MRGQTDKVVAQFQSGTCVLAHILRRDRLFAEYVHRALAKLIAI